MLSGADAELTVQGQEKEDWSRSGVTDGGSGGEGSRNPNKVMSSPRNSEETWKPEK